jgi:hypothetical protein
MKNLFIIASIAVLSTSIFSCKKKASDDPAPVAETGSARIEFEHGVGKDANGDLVPLKMDGTTTYTNNVSETFTVTTLKYFVSNVVFKKADGSSYAVPESYYFVDASNAASTLLTIANIPAGDYTSVEYLLGVDSTRNVSGAQTGALDKANNFWDWNNGYIFFKLEGTSPSISSMMMAKTSAGAGQFMYHIGGFRNANNTNALRTIKIDFAGNKLSVGTNKNPQVHVAVDILEALKTPNDISFATTSMVHMPGGTALKIADNYVNMFEFEHIHN